MTNASERYIEAVRYVGDLYDFLNSRFFTGALSKPVITLQADESSSKARALGWFVRKEIWKESSEDEGATEINLTAQYLDRPFEEIAATLLHEMCHQYAYAEKVQDCSRSGTYHNKLFKRIAETHGLKVECVKTIGWSHTELTDESRETLKAFESSHKLIYRLPTIKGARVKTSSTRKYICPVCGQSVRATKVVNIICADCNEPMQEED